MPTEIPIAMGETAGEPIVYESTPSGLLMAAGGRGYAVIPALDQLGEFPSVSPGGAPFTYSAGVTGLIGAVADGSGGAWAAGGTSRTLVRLSGASLTPGTPIALGFVPVKLAADAQRVWVAGVGGEGLAMAAGATASVSFGEVPSFMAADGSGGLWTADASPGGAVRFRSAPGAAPGAPVNLGGAVAALCTGDAGGVWAVLAGSPPSVVHHRVSGPDKAVSLGAVETPYGVASGGNGRAWVLTDKALYQVETNPDESLKVTRYPRTETWVPGGLAADPEDRRKIYALDLAGKAVRRLYTGS